jgi:hypothetical protein
MLQRLKFSIIYRSVLGELQGEENNQNGDGKTGVERSREDVIVLGPPGKVTSTRIEDISD